MKTTFYFTHYLVMTDISNSKRSQTIRSIILDYCYQQQSSIFEGQLTTSQIEKMKEKVVPLLDRKKDNLIIYPLTKQNIFSKQVYGKLKWEVKRIF